MTPPDTQTLLATDAASRRAAVTLFDRPVALEAGAGTGKTSVLVARVAWWCLTTGWQDSEALWRDHPPRWRKTPPGQGPTPQEVARLTAQRVAAITFTEAAAAELSQRLAALLGQLAQGDASGLHQMQDLFASGEAPALAQRARLLLGELHHMTLDTIHGFCARLLRRHAVAAALHPRFALDVDQSALSATVEEVMQRALHAALCAKTGEHPLALLLAQGHDMAAIGGSLLWLAQNGIEAPWLDQNPCPPETWEALKSEVLSQAGPLSQAVAALHSAARAKNSQEAALALHQWCAQWRQATQEKDFLEITQNTPGVLGTKMKDWAQGDFNKTEMNVLGDLAAIRRHAAALWPLVDQFTRLGQRPPATLRLIQRALRPLLEEVQARLSRQGQVTFNELLFAARRLLHDQPAIAQLERQRLGLLLVDEFQDTDAVQCDIVRALGLTGQNRPSLFVVGDPKQCIYVWRRADLASYEDFLQTLRGEGGEVFPLHANFRSRPEVLGEVDRLLAPLLLYQKGVQPHFEPLVAGREHPPLPPGDAAVEHWVSWSVEGPKDKGYADAAREIEAKAIARDLVRLRQSGQLARWADAAVLLRATGNQEIYLHALREHGVPYEVVAEKEWFHTRTVLEAAALLRLVLDPNDHLALLTFLRSAVVGVPDHALIPLWRTGLPQALTALSSPDPQALAGADACVQEALAHTPAFIGAGGGLPLWPVSLKAAVRGLAVLRRAFHHEPLDMFFGRWEDLFFAEQTEAARFGGHRRVGLLKAFFTLAGDALQGAGGPQALLRLLRQGAQGLQKLDQQKASLLGEGVQVMSVHGAKGLEFAHVYLPDLHHQETRTSRDDPNGWWLGEGGAAWTLADHPSLLAHRPRQLTRQNSCAEEVRLLYVAATRAKNRLVFLGHYPRDRSPRPLDQTTQQAQRLMHRQGGVPNLPELFKESLRCLSENTSATVAEKQALLRHTPAGEGPHAVWFFPDLDPAARLPRAGLAQKPALAGAAPLAAAHWQKTEETWALRQQQAAARQRRRWRAAASALSHEADEENFAPDEEGDPNGSRRGAPAAPQATGLVAPAGADNEVGRAVGVLCHQALERLDLAAGPAQAQQTCLASLPALASGLALGEAARAQAAQRAGEVMAQFFAGPLCLRLFDIRGHVLGRETPLVLSPDLLGGDGAPLGALTGTVDLLYQDPATGEVVVADYKTDAVNTAGELREKLAAYTLQGAVYVTAVQHALGLPRPPRFELWFLRLGEIHEAKP